MEMHKNSVNDGLIWVGKHMELQLGMLNKAACRIKEARLDALQ